MFTIRDLCKASKLSRSTILYYDSLGLLKPAERSESNYRLYTDESFKTLERICLYRDAGVTLEDIGTLLRKSENDDKKIDILERTLFRLNELTRKIQEKQNMITDMIKKLDDSNNIYTAFDDQCFEDFDRQESVFGFDIHKYVFGEEDT